MKTYNKNYRLLNGEKIREQAKTKRVTLRVEAIFIYSGGRMACDRCHDPEFRHLAIDHVDGGGTEHRKKVKRANCDMTGLLKDQGYPDGYRVLCHNCNYLQHIERVRSIDPLRPAMAKHRRKLKNEALAAYSDGAVKCAFCTVDDPDILTLDHISGGGREEMKKLKTKGGDGYYRWLKKNGYPSGLRVLCFSHNCGLRVSDPPEGFIEMVKNQMLASQGKPARSAA